MNWEKQPEWHGNPELGLESYKKVFKNPHNGRMVPVYIFGKEEHWAFCVSTGPNNDYSYTGGFPQEVISLQERQTYVDNLSESSKLFH